MILVVFTILFIALGVFGLVLIQVGKHNGWFEKK